MIDGRVLNKKTRLISSRAHTVSGGCGHWDSKYVGMADVVVI